MIASDACPSEATLQELVADQLPPDIADSLTDHIGACEVCQSRLATAAPIPDLGERLRNLEPQDAKSAHLAEAMRRAKALCESPLEAASQSAESMTNSEDATAFTQDGYELLGLIGRGGMGVVYKARERSLDRIVAVKVLSPMLASDDSARKRFLQEARAAAAVVHPNVITIHAVSDKPPLPYLVMEYVEGVSLQQHLDAGAKIHLENIVRIGRQVAAGLIAAHGKGVIHRDIKPGNILLNAKTGKVLLGDFGLALATGDSRLTRTGTVVGTPAYVAPEFLENPDFADHRADLFSLGVVLYAMCAGDSPFQADSLLGTLRRLSVGPPEPLSQRVRETPPWLSQIVMRLLDRDPDKRYQSAVDVREALGRRLAAPQPPDAPPVPPDVASRETDAVEMQVDTVVIPPPTPATRRRKKQAGGAVWFVGGSIVCIALLAVFGMMMRGGSQPSVAEDQPNLKPSGRGPDESGRSETVGLSTTNGSPGPDESPKEQGLFAIVDAEGEVLETHRSLADTLRKAPAGSTVEIRANGIVEVEPCVIFARSVTVTAADGYHPVLTLADRGDDEYQALFEIAGGAAFQGLELRLSEDHEEDELALFHVDRGGKLEIADCTLVVEESGYCVSSDAQTTLRNCVLHSPRSAALTGDEGAFFELRNCWVSGETGVELLAEGSQGTKLIESTFACLQVFRLHGDPDEDDMLQVQSSRSLFVCGDTMVALELESESTIGDVVAWTGDENVFSGNLLGEFVDEGDGKSQMERWREIFAEAGARFVESPFENGLDELPDMILNRSFRLSETTKAPGINAGATKSQ